MCIQIAIGIWLLAQYSHIGYYPNVGSRIGVRLTLYVPIHSFLKTQSQDMMEL